MTLFEEFVYHVICTGRLIVFDSLITYLISTAVKGWLMMLMMSLFGTKRIQPARGGGVPHSIGIVQIVST